MVMFSNVRTSSNIVYYVKKNIVYNNLVSETRMAMNVADIEKEWADRASRFLKAELKRADVTYEELAKRLNAKGWTETKASIANKLARGAFTATFFLASLAEIGCESVHLEDV